MLNVIGIVHSVGEYNGVSFDNYNLHCVRDADPTLEKEHGEITEVVKVKSHLFNEACVCVGDDLEVIYDRFGRVANIKAYR